MLEVGSRLILAVHISNSSDLLQQLLFGPIQLKITTNFCVFALESYPWLALFPFYSCEMGDPQFQLHNLLLQIIFLQFKVLRPLLNCSQLVSSQLCLLLNQISCLIHRVLLGKFWQLEKKALPNVHIGKKEQMYEASPLFKFKNKFCYVVA